MAHSLNARSFRARVLVVLASLMAGFCAVFAVQLLRSEPSLGDAEIGERLLATNPQVQHNEQITEAAAERVLATPSLDGRADGDNGLHREPASDAKPDDAEWAAYPRSTFHLARTVEDLASLTGGNLYRNVHLNPTDTWIAKGSRQRFEDWLTATLPEIQNMRAAVDTVAKQEMNHMIDMGIAPGVSYSSYVQSATDEERLAIQSERDRVQRELEEVGATEEQISQAVQDLKVFNPVRVVGSAFCHATRAGSDMVYTGSLTQMPQARQASQIYHLALLRMYGGILTFFQAQVALSDLLGRAEFEGVERASVRYRP